MKKKNKKNMGALSRFAASETRKMIDPYRYRCPFCGSVMKYETQMELYGNGDDTEKRFLECPDCGAYCQTRESGKKTYLVSTPAAKETRLLRQEAHFYFDRLYREGIIQDRGIAYSWLAMQLGYNVFSKSQLRHIGEFGEEFCKKTIELSIKKLCENKEKIGHRIPIYEVRGRQSYTQSRKDLCQMLLSTGRVSA